MMTTREQRLEVLEKAIESGITSSRPLKPGEVISRMKPADRAVLETLTSDDTRAQRHELSHEGAFPMSETPRKCPLCDGMDAICEVCGHADGDCKCDDGPELIPCPRCHAPKPRNRR